MSVTLTTVSTIESAASITTQLLGIATMATLPAAAAALAYRSLAEEKIPGWLAVAVGIAVVALYLGTTPALEVLLEETDPSPLAAALFDIGALLLAVGGAALGREVGDRFGVDVLVWSPTQTTGEVSQLAQALGQVTTVALPQTIEDAPGYDPVAPRSKDALAGTQFVFPRGLTVDELEARITEQLRSDYGIGIVDIRFDAGGTVISLAVGTRAAGIGATLPPATNAVAVRADPGFSASTGDIVQIWEPDSMQRVCTGELRGVSEDVVTLAIDAADTPKIDPTRRYRLVTLPVNDRPDREFASLLRAAEETFSTATVEAGSPLHGLPVGALDLTITAVRPDGADPVPFPDRDYRLAPGDLLFVIATPSNLRRLEDGATALDPSIASSPPLSTDDAEPAEGIQTGQPTATARDEPTGEDGLPAGNVQAQAADTASADETGPDVPVDDQSDRAASANTGGDTAIDGKADSESFQEIKADFEDGTETTETTEEAEASDTAGGTSFDELKSEFESGEADWEDETSQDEPADASPEPEPDQSAEDDLPDSEDIEIAFADDDPASEAGTDDGDELVSLDEADISFDDDLQGDADDAISDDIGDLEFEDGDDEDEAVSELDLSEDDGLFDSIDDEDDADEDDDEDDESEDSADEEEDDDDDSDSGGGGTSFAQLKEEFDSGDADWEDDVSDSPGGDMRLDE